ncbi:hypothetical protein U1Q18_011522, partial [Sarracenia purpurea var. burkii]
MMQIPSHSDERHNHWSNSDFLQDPRRCSSSRAPPPSIVAPPLAEAVEPTTRRVVNSSAPTSPTTFAMIVRRAVEVLRGPESGNP